MTAPTEENIATVMRGFEEFLAYMIKTKNVNLQEFVNFMEPKFAAAGYRDRISRAGGNILILTEGGAGDFISDSGAVREIRRLYPDARITLIACPRTRELAECCPYVDELIFNSQEFPSSDVFELYKLDLLIAQTLLEQRFDICFAFAINAQTPLLMYMSGAKTRVTSVNHENLSNVNNNSLLIAHVLRLATHLFPCSAYGGHHADDAFALLENLLHLPITNRKLEVWYTPADVGAVKSHLKDARNPIYALCMGGTGFPKKYPPEKYARLLEMILDEEPTATFVILGGGQGDLKSAAIFKNAAPQIYANNVIDLTNKLSFRQSGAALSFCKMYIGNDTGTMHIATAANCPVLEPNCFAADLPVKPTDMPQVYYPYGVPSVIVQPKHALPECKNRRFYFPYGCLANAPHCITQIEPETLFNAFKLLKKRVAAGFVEPLYMS